MISTLMELGKKEKNNLRSDVTQCLLITELASGSVTGVKAQIDMTIFSRILFGSRVYMEELNLEFFLCYSLIPFIIETKNN